MQYNMGDFIITNESIKPGVVIKNNLVNNLVINEVLVSIYEFGGDYIWLDYNNITLVNLTPEEKLSVLGNFECWFYDAHPLLYQEIILENILNF